MLQRHVATSRGNLPWTVATLVLQRLSDAADPPAVPTGPAMGALAHLTAEQQEQHRLAMSW
jgi:hypothetical protein